MLTCNRLDLQTLGSQPIMSKNPPDHYIVEVKILVLIKWSHKSFQLRSPLSSEWVACFEHIVQSLWNTRESLWSPFLNPHLITYHSNLCVQIIAMLDLGSSTLWSSLHPER